MVVVVFPQTTLMVDGNGLRAMMRKKYTINVGDTVMPINYHNYVYSILMIIVSHTRLYYRKQKSVLN